jgi:DNA-binding transcriptional MerR regulator/tetratricopeptide (TPR) repeat protein
MAELASRSGVPRETIHFYLREGLLPRPRKAGRTVAYYDEGHLERLRLVRRLREEKYLPIAVIRRLLDSPAAAAERDIDALAEVLHIVPGLGAEARAAKMPDASAEAVRTAEELGLLGVRSARDDGASAEGDLTVRRVLAIVEDALALKGAARALTLEDLSVCAADLTVLVTREAEVFFDAVLRSGDLGGSIAALREGRGVVARFITAYRDRMLRKIIDDLLEAMERGPEVAAQARTVPLSAAKLAELGALEVRAALEREASGDPAGRASATSRLAWHLFACGAGEGLAALGENPGILLGDREAVLAAWGAHERSRTPASLRALERAADAAPDFALGQILLGEAALVRALRRRDAGAGLLEEAVPALHRLVGPDLEKTESRIERALCLFHRGRVELALPPVLGRRRRGAEALERALAILSPRDIPGLDPAACALLSANARLALGRFAAQAGSSDRAKAYFEEAAAVDPEGPIGVVAREELGALNRS